MTDLLKKASYNQQDMFLKSTREINAEAQEYEPKCLQSRQCNNREKKLTQRTTLRIKPLAL